MQGTSNTKKENLQEPWGSMEREMLTVPADTRSEADVQQFLEEASPQVRDKAAELIRHLDTLQPEKALQLCNEILRVQPDYTQVEFSKAELLFMSGKRNDLRSAAKILKKLKKERPEDKDVWILSGKISVSLERYSEARDAFRKVFPLESYEPFAYQDYGVALEHLHQDDEALAMFRKDLEEYEKTKDIPNDMMLDASFQRALLLEIDMARNSAGTVKEYFTADMELYKQFLLQADMTEPNLQQAVSSTVVYMSMQLDQKWLRKPFVAFAAFLDEHKLLTGTYELTIITAFSSAESYEIREDDQVSGFVWDYINCADDAFVARKHMEITKKKNASDTDAGQSSDVMPSTASDLPADLPREQEESLPEEYYRQTVTNLVYQWHMLRYRKGHEEELEHVRETYPHSWKYIEECLSKADADPAYPDKLIDQILVAFQQEGEKLTRADLLKEMERDYSTAIRASKQE